MWGSLRPWAAAIAWLLIFPTSLGCCSEPLVKNTSRIIDQLYKVTSLHLFTYCNQTLKCFNSELKCFNSELKWCSLSYLCIYHNPEYVNQYRNSGWLETHFRFFWNNFFEFVTACMVTNHNPAFHAQITPKKSLRSTTTRSWDIVNLVLSQNTPRVGFYVECYKLCVYTYGNQLFSPPAVLRGFETVYTSSRNPSQVIPTSCQNVLKQVV